MRLLDGLRAPIDRLVGALTDPQRRERAVIGVLLGYAAIWALYGVLAKAGQDVQIDAAELVAWARHPALGYTKHPPLAAWLVHAWFALFPVADWSYYLFGTLYAGIGLWLAWQLFKYYLDAEKRVVALALLTFVPIYNFFTLRFDVNAVLPPLWAATALCFLRSYETRQAGWATLAGVAAAAAMLGKYWSLFLLLGLALAAILDARRDVYFRSRAPWITVAVGALLIAPHLVWLVQSDFSPLHYAFAERETHSFFKALHAVAGYLAGGAGYMAVPVLLALAAGRPSRAALADTLWPQSAERRFVLVAFFAPLLLPALIALVSKLDINSIWTMCGFTLLPAVLLASPKISVPHRATQAIVAAAVAFPLLMTIAAPAIALIIHVGNRDEVAMYGKMLADRILVEWRKDTDRPLSLVGGDLDLAYVTTFYLPGAASPFPVTEPTLAPWVTPERIARDGIVLACHVELDLKYGQICVHGYVQLAMTGILKDMPQARRIEVELTRRFMGIAGRPARFLVYIVPPR